MDSSISHQWPKAKYTAEHPNHSEKSYIFYWSWRGRRRILAKINIAQTLARHLVTESTSTEQSWRHTGSDMTNAYNRFEKE